MWDSKSQVINICLPLHCSLAPMFVQECGMELLPFTRGYGGILRISVVVCGSILRSW